MRWLWLYLLRHAHLSGQRLFIFWLWEMLLLSLSDASRGGVMWYIYIYISVCVCVCAHALVFELFVDIHRYMQKCIVGICEEDEEEEKREISSEWLIHSAGSPFVQNPAHFLAIKKDKRIVCVKCSSARLAILQDGAVGLSNLINSCYLNAAVQAIVHVPSFAAFFIDCIGSVNSTNLNSLTRKMATLVRSIWLTREPSLTPRAFVNHVRASSRQFASYGQQVRKYIYIYIYIHLWSIVWYFVFIFEKEMAHQDNVKIVTGGMWWSTKTVWPEQS